MDPLPIAIIADDLTGAADTAAAFARPGRPVPVSLNEKPVLSEGAAAFAVTTESRASSPEAASEVTAAAARGVLAAGAGLIYKKVDSNLRGNIGAELAALYEVAARPILLAPAFPARGRTTENGVVLIHGVPASETEMARDPEAPLSHSGIAEIIHSQRPDLPVGHLSLGDLPITAIDLSRRLDQTPILIADATTDADLDLIAEAALAMNPPPILAGSAGLASALSRQLFGGGTNGTCREFTPRAEGPCAESEQKGNQAAETVPKSVPSVPKGVPFVPLGVPSVPKSVPFVPFVP
ncbi:MAG TPA: four-carbon acid sugar kinase family protein, partial [Phycisphaerae bacterium]|nr:four-carbon acid sugar kinase family protein [Phycisphaerae bacterium]